jgi:putative ABC transport system permease protein
MKQVKRILKDWRYLLINAIGLSTAFACMLIIFLFCRQQMSFDRFHSKADRIYRITIDSNNGATSMHPARVAGDGPKKLAGEYPAIEKVVRLVPFRKAIIKIGDQKFYSKNAFSTDSTFFQVFDFKVLSGNASDAFKKPGQAFICRSLALKYFGSLDVIGKEITVLNQQETSPGIFNISGVMEDFPSDSHFHAEILTSYTETDSQSTWAYTYFLMKPGTDAVALRNTIQKRWDEENKSAESKPVIYLQKLTDIHLYSHLTREMEKNGDIRSVILLASGALIIMFIALLNFLNLSRVQFLKRLKSVKIKIINGASKSVVASEFAGEALWLSILSVLTGLIVSVKLNSLLGMSVFAGNTTLYTAAIATGFSLLIVILSVYPVFTSKIVSDMKLSRSGERLYSVPLIIQFALAVVTIISTLVLNHQMDFINSKHPSSQNANMLVIADNPWESVQRYELFKTELLKDPSITNVTSAMEEPGGDILDNFGFEMEGVEKNDDQSINIFTADSNFFKTMNIHPLAGTIDLGYTPSQKWEADAIDLSNARADLENNKEKTQILSGKIAEYEKRLGGYREKYILNESALRLLGIKNPADAIGKHFRLTFFMPDLFPEGEIVGVVPDFHYTNLHSEEKPLVIAPRKMFNYCFIVSINPGQRKRAMATVNSVWKKINPDFPLQYEYITDSYHKIYAGEYAQTRVLSLFAIISVILSALGIFAMSSFSIQRRVKEIGIRKVNGARVSEVMTMLNEHYLRQVLVSFVIAAPAAWYIMHRWLENFAYRTDLSWWIFAVSGLLALGVALLTVSWQSWRAATRNPVEALRYE